MKKKVLWIAVVILLVAVTALTTFAVTVTQLSARLSAAADPVTAKLGELAQYIDLYFIDDYDEAALTAAAADGAASAMVAATGDRWSYYIPADEYDEVMNNKNNTYVGIGITIMATQDGTGLEILKLEPEGPAREAGILPGDILTAVEGQSVKDLGTNGAADLIQGEPGTFVNVEVLREGETLAFTVERRQIQQQVATYEMLPDKVGYIKIVNFNTNCAKDTIAAVDALIEQGAESLVFDVRFNPGGYTSELVEVLDYLLPEGPLFRGVDYLEMKPWTSRTQTALTFPWRCW